MAVFIRIKFNKNENYLMIVIVPVTQHNRTQHNNLIIESQNRQFQTLKKRN